MNRAIYLVTPVCPKCLCGFQIPSFLEEKIPLTQEIPVKCTTLVHDGLVLRPCGWEGFAAFFMEDKVIAPRDVLIQVDEKGVVSTIPDMPISEHCKNSGCHLIGDDVDEKRLNGLIDHVVERHERERMSKVDTSE